MRVRCLVYDPAEEVMHTVSQAVGEVTNASIVHAPDFRSASHTMQNTHPNLVFVRCGVEGLPWIPLLKIIRRGTQRTAIVPMIEQPTKDLLAAVLPFKGVVDVVTGEFQMERVKQSVHKAMEALFGVTSIDSPSKYYRGFVSFVGITPTLNHRRLLTKAQLGVLHNRSVRLAIEYWRNNPNCQMISIALNKTETFSSRQDESLEFWEDYELLPWEIAMYEAQGHYMNYWDEAIERKLLPFAIPTMVQEGMDSLAPVDPALQMETFKKITELTKQGVLEESMQSMGVTFKMKSSTINKACFDDVIEEIDAAVEQVDKELPHLTRPPEETGYEDFKPDKAEQKDDESWRRMAFTSKSRR